MRQTPMQRQINRATGVARNNAGFISMNTRARAQGMADAINARNRENGTYGRGNRAYVNGSGDVAFS